MIDAIAKERSSSVASDRSPVAEAEMNLHDGALGSSLPLRINVAPVSGRMGIYSVRVNGKDDTLCASRQPLLDAARHLILGHNPDIIIEMWWADAEHFSIRARLGTAAGLTVDEHNGPVLARWKPFPGSSVPARIGPAEQAATPLAPQ